MSADAAALVAALTKRKLSTTVAGTRVAFAASQELFSSHQVDRGSSLLLRSLVDAPWIGDVRSVEDLGCGYGTLGLGLAAAFGVAAHVWDRDALAVAFTAANAASNGLHVDVSGALDLTVGRRGPADLLVSNPPAKMPARFFEHLLARAPERVGRGGRVALVVVNEIAAELRSLLKRSDHLTVTHEGAATAHTVLHLTVEAGHSGATDGFALGIYDRAVIVTRTSGVEFTVRTVYGLPDFDTLGHATALTIKAIARMARAAGTVALVNCGQGHIGAAVTQLLRPSRLDIFDRDLLGLRAAERAVRDNGGAVNRLGHVAVPILGAGTDLAVVVIGAKSTAAMVAETVTSVLREPPAHLLLSGPSTAISRAAALALATTRVSVERRERRNGHSVAVLRHRR